MPQQHTLSRQFRVEPYFQTGITLATTTCLYEKMILLLFIFREAVSKAILGRFFFLAHFNHFPYRAWIIGMVYGRYRKDKV